MYLKVILLVTALLFGTISSTQKLDNERYRREADDGQYHPDNEGQYAPSGDDGQYHPDDSGKYVHQDVKYVHEQIDPLKYVHVQIDPLKYVHDDNKYVDKDGGYARTDKDGQYLHDDSGKYAYADKYTQGGVGKYVQTIDKYNYKDGGVYGAGKSVAGYSGKGFGSGADGSSGFGQLNIQSNLQNIGNDGKYVSDDSGKYVHVDSKYTYQGGLQGGLAVGNDIQKYSYGGTYSISGNKIGAGTGTANCDNGLIGKTVTAESGFGNKFGTGSVKEGGSQLSVLSIPDFFPTNTDSTGGFGVRYTEGFATSAIGSGSKASSANEGKYVHDDSGKYFGVNDGKYSQSGKTSSTLLNVFSTGGTEKQSNVASPVRFNNAASYGTIQSGNSILTSEAGIAPSVPSFFDNQNIKSDVSVGNIGVKYSVEKTKPIEINSASFGLIGSGKIDSNDGNYAHDNSGDYVHENTKYSQTGGSGSGYASYASGNDGKYVHDNSGNYVHVDEKYKTTGTAYGGYGGSGQFTGQNNLGLGIVKYQTNTGSVVNEPEAGLVSGVFPFFASGSTIAKNVGVQIPSGTLDNTKVFTQSGFNSDGQYVHDDSGKYVHVESKYTPIEGVGYSGGTYKYTVNKADTDNKVIGFPGFLAVTKPVLHGFEIKEQLSGGSNGQVAQTGGFSYNVNKQSSNTGFQYNSAGTPFGPSKEFGGLSSLQANTGYAGQTSFGGQIVQPAGIGLNVAQVDSSVPEFFPARSGDISSVGNAVQTYQYSQTSLSGELKDVCGNSQWSKHKNICLKLKAACLANTKNAICNNEAGKEAACSQMIYSIMTVLYELNALK